MSKLLNDWSPSESALNLIKFNGVDDEQIQKSLEYLKGQKDLSNIDDVDGYDNWDAFFIMFCIKASGKSINPN